ncbi:M48 family metallopeptidase [Streptomyces sp. P17]|nr:M48 family metallopeptidase [Streptomyces sp. P17]MDT9701391.1 M48 family metallopeptidase [Streptomyces sp. P17]
MRVARSEATRLWQLITELAKEMHAPMPAHLWLTPDANCSVYELPQRHADCRWSRHLCVGVPLLVGMTTSQLRAAIAHELGHYAQERARLGTTIHRGTSILRATTRSPESALFPTSDIDAIVQRVAGFQHYLLERYAVLYDTVTLAVRRRHEYAADRTAAAVVGSKMMADALLAAEATNRAWGRFISTYRPRYRHAKPKLLMPEDPFQEFAHQLSGTSPASSTTPDPQQPETSAARRSSRRDAHPPLAQRLAALTVDPVAGTSAYPNQDPAMTLVSGELRLIRRAADQLRSPESRCDTLERFNPGRILRWGTIPFTLAAWLASWSVPLAWGHFFDSATFWVLYFGNSVAFSAVLLSCTLLLSKGNDRWFTATAPAPRKLRRAINLTTALYVYSILALGFFGAREFRMENLGPALIVGWLGVKFCNPRAETSLLRIIFVCGAAMGFLMQQSGTWPPSR